MNSLVYVVIDQGIHISEKVKVARNEKQKIYMFFLNIANFEAFLWSLILSANHLFWSCGTYIIVFSSSWILRNVNL